MRSTRRCGDSIGRGRGNSSHFSGSLRNVSDHVPCARPRRRPLRPSPANGDLETKTVGSDTTRYTYDAFGNLLASTGSTPNQHLYTGEQFDANVGSYYLRARYYNPSNGRFLTSDPASGSAYEPASLHKYVYAYDDPINQLDPSGLMTIKQLMVLVVVVAILALVAHVLIKPGAGGGGTYCAPLQCERTTGTWLMLGKYKGVPLTPRELQKPNGAWFDIDWAIDVAFTTSRVAEACRNRIPFLREMCEVLASYVPTLTHIGARGLIAIGVAIYRFAFETRVEWWERFEWLEEGVKYLLGGWTTPSNYQGVSVGTQLGLSYLGTPRQLRDFVDRRYLIECGVP